MKKKKWFKLQYILAAAVILLIVFVLIAKSTGLLDKRNQTEVELAPAEINSITETVGASGSIQPEVEVKISPDVPGEIIELHVEEDSATAVLLLRDLLVW